MSLKIEDLTEQTVTVTVAGEELTFKVAPEEFTTWMQAMKWASDQNLLAGRPGDLVGGVVMGHYALIARITAWEGLVDGDGAPLPCDEAAKLAFFGRYPQALLDVAEALRQREVRAEKNSETSPTG